MRASSLRFHPFPLLGLLLASSAPGCVAAPAEVTPIGLRDPLGLIGCDAGETTGCVPAGALRLFVLPAASFACSSGGGVSPDIVDAPVGETPDAVVDITLTVTGGAARQEVVLPAGDWVVLVRGKGTDPVSMRPDVVVANGCAPVAGFAAGETREVSVTVLPVTGSGVCGDTVVSPDEQCEPPSSATCDAMCRTLPFLVNTTAAGRQEGVALASRPGRRMIATWDTERQDVGLRLLDAEGRGITSPVLLGTDRTLTQLLMDQSLPGLPGAQVGAAPAVAASGRVAFALVDYIATPNLDVRLFFMDENRVITTNNVAVTTTTTGVQDDPSVAFSGDGSLMVAFHDDQAATGLSAAFFAAGGTMPAGAAVAVGSGTGGTAPAVAGTDAGFVLAYASGGDVFFQRFAAAGTPTDAMGRNVLDTPTGTQDQPAVAALPAGGFMVAWRDTEGDGMGTSIRARAFGADGAPRGAPLLVNTTAAGDQARPAIAGADARFAITFESAGAVRARIYSDAGAELLNRERPPSTSDFELAATGSLPAVAAVGSAGTAAWLFAWSAPTDGAGEVFVRHYPR